MKLPFTSFAALAFALAACGEGGTAKGPETVETAQTEPTGPPGYQPEAQYMNPEVGAGSGEGGRSSATTGASSQGAEGLAAGETAAKSKQSPPATAP